MTEHKELLIEANTTLTSVQAAFTAYFPFLKVEFFKHFHKQHGGSPKKDILQKEALLQFKKTNASTLHISEDMSVSALENMFKEYFGIGAQVFRKSGKSWLETTLTDDWSLKKQNDEGQELSSMQKD